MGFVAEGKYVVAASDRTLVHKTNVDVKTLNKIAALLGIPKAERDKLIATTRSIHIFRGGARPSKKK